MHDIDFEVFIHMENVITRKAPRRIHGSDRRPTVEVIIRVPPALSYNAGRVGLVCIKSQVERESELFIGT
jgi:hypothetical protein